jgi:hypothetical protein
MDDDISYDGADTTGIFEEFFNEGLSNVIKKHSRHPMESVMDAIERDSDDAHKPIIRLYEGRTEYTENELRLLQTRDFKTRLFISNQSVNFNSVWLRNHHTDNAEHWSNFTYIRDYFKAACKTSNHSAAKSTLTVLLTTMFAMEDSAYNSFASIVASALSEKAQHTSFEVHPGILEDRIKLDTARNQLLILMDALFSKIKIRSFLLDRKNSNIYRLVHCLTKGNKNKRPMIYAFFSFLVQSCLTIFVILHVAFQGTQYDYEKDDTYCKENRTKNVCINQAAMKLGLPILALLGAIYAFLIALPEIYATIEAYNLYGKKVGMIQMMDFIVNIIIPLTLVFSGVFVIWFEKAFIDSVLNPAALLFIPEIDDHLPKLLSYDEKAIVQNFLIMEAKNEYEEQEFIDEGKAKAYVDKKDLGVEFNDYFITNSTERGRDAQDFALYQPFIVKKTDGDRADEIDPSNYVTADCLLKQVEWKYTSFLKNDTTKPRVGWLKLRKLNGEIVEFNCSHYDELELRERTHFLPEGVYVITSFTMSSSILKLTLCGSKSGIDFVRAMNYYSLFRIDPEAMELLRETNCEIDGRKASSREFRRDCEV